MLPSQYLPVFLAARLSSLDRTPRLDEEAAEPAYQISQSLICLFRIAG